MSLRSILKREKSNGYKVYEFGDRLKLERPHKGVESPLVTKHLSEAEYEEIRDLIDGIDVVR